MKLMVTALLLTGLLAGLATAAYAGEPREINAKGPEGNLAGTVIPADGR